MFKKISNILKIIWTELTRVRSIDFRSYETEYKTNKRLNSELQARIQKIREQNSKKRFDEYMPIAADEFVSQHGYIPSFQQLAGLCLKKFTKDIIDGKLDGLYEEISNE